MWDGPGVEGAACRWGRGPRDGHSGRVSGSASFCPARVEAARRRWWEGPCCIAFHWHLAVYTASSIASSACTM